MQKGEVLEDTRSDGKKTGVEQGQNGPRSVGLGQLALPVLASVQCPH
jgi:hypothetical protein